MDIKLGDRAKDSITGFDGVVIARTEWLNGCIRLTIQPEKIGEDGKPIEACTFDSNQIELLQQKVAARPERATEGPFPSPELHRDPK